MNDNLQNNENYFSLSELYHENSKMRLNDHEFYAWINHVNSSPEIRNVISKPNYNYNGNNVVPLSTNLEVEEEKKFFYNVFRNRRSVREYSDQPLSIQDISRLLFLGDGVTCDMSYDDGSTWKMRTAPSPGGLFPIEIFCIIQNVTGMEPGLYLYSPVKNELIELYTETRENLYLKMVEAMRPMKTTIENSAVTFVLLSNMPRINFKYKERAYRFAMLETGHIAQNLLLAAEAEDLGAVCVGGFLDNEINEMLRVDGLNKFVQYCIPVGVKKG